MYCRRCGNYLPDDTVMCDICGEVSHSDTQNQGVRAMRQGRKGSARPQVLPDSKRREVPEYGDFDMSPLPPEQPRNVRRNSAKQTGGLSRPDTRSGVPVLGSAKTQYVSSQYKKLNGMQYHRFNWMLLIVIILILILMAAAGYFIYMNVSDEGQRITARKIVIMATDEMIELATTDDNTLVDEQEELLEELNAVPVQTYWLVGEDYMEIGDMASSIKAFTIANILDPENYDGLYEMATVYELDEQDDLAEEIYLDLIENISPTRSEAYTALISLYISQERNQEAADLMLLAYETTEKETFRLQRTDFIPEKPEVNSEQTAGRYELAQYIELTSPQGYDIYYTLDDEAVLPEDGILMEGGSVLIEEGTFTLRAVCVLDDLHSDEFEAEYTVYYPTPSAPKCNLASGTYSKLYSVSLRAGDKSDDYSSKTEEQQAKEDDLTYYYTIDGSDPDPDLSPIYDGTPIELPAGRVELHAIVVNGYGKQSSTLEVDYKFSVSPYLEDKFSYEDTFDDFELEETLLAEFEEAIGEAESEETIEYRSYDGDAKQLNYSWGHAIFILSSNSWELVEVDMTRNISSPPRGVGVGDSEDEIVAEFKDFGMPDNQDGSRNLYYDDPDIATIEINDDGTKTIQYITESVSSNVMYMQYVLNEQGVCTEIIHYVIP